MEPTPSLVRRFNMRRIGNAQPERVMDTVAAEEPLEIRVEYWFKDARVSAALALAMRTPGHDRELAAGFLFSEGIVRQPSHILDLRPLGGEPSNEIVAELSKDVDLESWHLARHTFTNSSCGVCGKRSRDAVAQLAPFPSTDALRLDASLISKLPALVAAGQEGFAQTGGLHAAALIDSAGEIGKIFEDIGRHNALDKLIGWSLLNGRIPLSGSLLFLSSRSSFELVQKTIMAGAPVLATVGGPSSLAIETARQFGLTLLGFVRDGRFNVYSGEWRIHSY